LKLAIDRAFIRTFDPQENSEHPYHWLKEFLDSFGDKLKVGAIAGSLTNL